jgi:uncharacterized membrane protein YdjX (TVP38/TMEM64 family)
VKQGVDGEATTKAGGLSRRRLAPLVAIAGAILLFFALDFDQYLSFETLKENRHALLEWRDRNGMTAVLIYIIGYIVAVALSLPGAIWLTISGGFLFGTLFGTVYAVVAGTIGAALVFIAARYALGDYLRNKAGPTVRKLEGGFRKNALSYLLFLRLTPVVPFWLVNLVPAFLGVRLSTFIIGTFFGIIPLTAVFASVGNGLGAVIDAGRKPDLSIVFDPAIVGPIFGLAMIALLPAAYKSIKAGFLKKQ